jgi:MFS family permease
VTEAGSNILSPKQARIACAVFFFISGFSYSAWASRIPAIQQKLHLNEAQLGAILFAMPAGLMLTLPVTKRLLGVYSSKGVLMFGAIAFNVILSLIGFANETWQLTAVLVCFGSARNLMNLSVNAQSVNVQALYDRSIITTFHGIWSLAGFAGAALGYGMVSFNVLPHWHLLTVSIAMTALAVYFYPFVLYVKPVQEPQQPIFTLPNKHLLKFAIICFASMACENTLYDWSGIYFAKAVHASKHIVTVGFVAYMTAMTLGRFAGDRLVTRFGIKPILYYSGFLIFVGLLVSVLLPQPITAGIGFVMTGLGVSCIVPLVFSLAGRSTAFNSGTAIASVSTIGYLGFLLVPPVVGFIAEVAGLRWSFGIISLLGLLIVWMVRGIKENDES